MPESDFFYFPLDQITSLEKVHCKWQVSFKTMEQWTLSLNLDYLIFDRNFEWEPVYIGNTKRHWQLLLEI